LDDDENGCRPPRPSSNPDASTNTAGGKPSPTTYYGLRLLRVLAAAKAMAVVVCSWAEWRRGLCWTGEKRPFEEQNKQQAPCLYLRSV